MATQKSDEKNTKVAAQQTELKEGSKISPIILHFGAYLFLLLAAMLYFKPIAFDGMSLQQHDNQQSIQMQAEIIDYRDNKNQRINWTNQLFGGMPTSIMSNPNKNYCAAAVWQPVRLYKPYSNEWICLFLIMLGSYIGLALVGVESLLAVTLSLILGFFTSNTLFIAAGHTGKMQVLATIPVVIGGLIYAYKRNPIVGAGIFALGLSLNMNLNHVQITYYMFFAMVFIGLFLLIDAVKEKELPKFAKFAGLMVVAVLLGVLSNLGLLWPNYEYGKSSTRGNSELTKKAHTQGLDPDYVFGLSIEKMETAALMFPNFHGGTQGKNFVEKEGSATKTIVYDPAFQQQVAAVAKSNGWDPNEFLNQVVGQYGRQYRGSQTMSGGPIYYGVVVCFLFILAMFLLQGALKWGILSALMFLLVLAWGKHFAVFNDFMYYYFPLYNKFRDTKMTLLVAQPIVILAIGLGLKELINFDASKYENTLGAKLLPKIKQTVSKQGYVLLAGVVALGLCVFAYLYASMATLSSPNDDALFKISPQFLAALYEDRAALIKSDVVRAIGFILPTFAALYLYAKGTLPKVPAILAIAVLACLDLGMVNSDYLNKDSYVEQNYIERAQLQPTQADSKILQDKSYFRVADYSQGPPSQSARACAFHKSVGGYFAAKPLLYQELWNGYNMDDGNVALKQNGSIFNMMNVKYFIISPTQVMENPTAMGPAWFVSEIKQVDDANQELEGLAGLPVQTTAVVQKKYAAKYLEGLTNTNNPADKIYIKTYHPDTMTYVSETAGERFAVFSEMYYPDGWSVYINDKKVEGFVKTNYMLRGLRVPAGKNVIKMVFEPQAVTLGVKVGAATSILILLWLGFVIFKYVKGKSEIEA